MSHRSSLSPLSPLDLYGDFLVDHTQNTYALSTFVSQYIRGPVSHWIQVFLDSWDPSVKRTRSELLISLAMVVYKQQDTILTICCYFICNYLGSVSPVSRARFEHYIKIVKIDPEDCQFLRETLADWPTQVPRNAWDTKWVSRTREDLLKGVSMGIWHRDDIVAALSKYFMSCLFGTKVNKATFADFWISKLCPDLLHFPWVRKVLDKWDGSPITHDELFRALGEDE